MAASNITTASIHSEDKPSKLIKVQSKDEQIFEIDEGIIEQFTALKELYETLPVGDEPIPLFNVNASLLIPILEFCKYHKNDTKSGTIDDDVDDDDPNKDSYGPKKSDDISAWDRDFIQRFTVQDGTLFDIIKAANYLGIKSLMEVGLKTIANMVRGKPASEVRDMFTISIDQPNALETNSTN